MCIMLPSHTEDDLETHPYDINIFLLPHTDDLSNPSCGIGILLLYQTIPMV